LTLDRIDNDRGYEPGNVQWATRAQQGKNRATTCSYVLAFGESKPLPRLAREFGLKPGTVYYRLRQGMPPEAALTKPAVPTVPRFSGSKHHASTPISDGSKRWDCIPDAAAETGIPYSTLRRWARSGRNGWRLA
jgi:hypothetical protein